MAALTKIEYEREEFCRFEDYARYSKHITGKLSTLRKSPDSGSDVLLFGAERAWSKAMQIKDLGGKTQAILNKLRKACKYGKEVVESLSDSDATNRLQAITYEDILKATLAQERGAHDTAILHYSRALVALQNTTSKLLQTVEAGLRFSIYQTRAEERSINLQKFALQQISENGSQDSWRALVTEVNPNTLERQRDEQLITTIEWASRTAHLKNPDLVSLISTAVSGRSSLDATSKPMDYDTILAAWSAASSTLQSLLDVEEDQDLLQELELTKAWLSYHSSLDRLNRDKSLISTVSNREGVLLCDSMLRTYNQVLALPGLSREQQNTLESQRHATRGERCISLAETHGSSLEAIALLKRALHYYTSSDPRRREVILLLNRHTARYTFAVDKRVHLVKSKWYKGNVKQLGMPNSDDLVTRSITMKPVVFDIAWNYIVAGSTSHTSHALSTPDVDSKDTDRMELDDLLPKKPESSKKGLFGGLFGGRS